MEEFKLTEKFKEKGYIHCNSLEEYNDMIKWFKNNSIIANTEYDYNNLYSTNLHGSAIFDCGYFKYNNNKPLSGGFYIIEWTNYMSTDNKTFTKDMLKDGMVVELKNEDICLKLGESSLITLNKDCKYKTYNIGNYNNNLKYKATNNYDVIKIYKIIENECESIALDNICDKSRLTLIWERKEENPLELTMEDIEKQYGCKVKIVNK
ncbi:hypothetical protein AB2T90_12050 [Clostridium butyricum]|uniref:hypothetical protein n=1 Tax=Clostridium butyricum TaxID=1492 RepID=UPI0034668F59